MKRFINFFLVACYFPLLATFSGETLVKMQQSYNPIQDIKLHDFVVSSENNVFDYKSVIHIYAQQVRKKVVIILEADTLVVSQEQQLYCVENKNFQRAEDFISGQHLLDSRGKMIEICSINIEKCDEVFFGISVANFHTYFVSSAEVLVHNFAPVAIGLAWVFGSGVIEFAGISIYTAVLGLVVTLHRRNNGDNSQNNDYNTMGNMDISFGSPNPEDPDKKNKKQVTIAENNSQHIFRNSSGHFSDTPQNRQALIDVASNENNFLGADKYGNSWYAEFLPSGKQIWVSVRNSIIKNGGINDCPKSFNPQSGLCKL